MKWLLPSSIERCAVFLQTLMSVSMLGHKAGLEVRLISLILLSRLSWVSRPNQCEHAKQTELAEAGAQAWPAVPQPGLRP